jgi:hypothetical protein
MIGRNLAPKLASKILAKTMYKELKRMGFMESDIINFSSEIIEHLKKDILIGEESGKYDDVSNMVANG